MPPFASRRSLDKAAGERAQFSSSVNGEEEEKEDAKKQETQIALDQPIRCNCQSPHGKRESI